MTSSASMINGQLTNDSSQQQIKYPKILSDAEFEATMIEAQNGIKHKKLPLLPLYQIYGYKKEPLRPKSQVQSLPFESIKFDRDKSLNKILYQACLDRGPEPATYLPDYSFKVKKSNAIISDQGRNTDIVKEVMDNLKPKKPNKYILKHKQSIEESKKRLQKKQDSDDELW
ncbi:Hypothetical_protein [Hexamita inflata]|uniref:Hypothetical_protein n=1 Tax=Hexamita inflata TaxID=28002 RepID=A0AA86N5D4_9EUKA|nr:Hypothetical protein HINF_LOCUS879 [Hexamita inflata]